MAAGNEVHLFRSFVTSFLSSCVGLVQKYLRHRFQFCQLHHHLYSLPCLYPPHLIFPPNSVPCIRTTAHSASPNLTGPARVHTTNTFLPNNLKMPLKEVPRPYPLIDSDPHFSRVVRYMRPNDYALWAGAAAAGPGLLWLYGGS